MLTFGRLFSNNIGDPGATAIAKALEVNASLNFLDLRVNSIGDAAKAELRTAATARPSLTIEM